MNGWHQEQPRPPFYWAPHVLHRCPRLHELSTGSNFEGCKKLFGRAPPYLHLVLDPWPNGIGLSSKLASQTLIGVLAGQLLLQGLIPDGHELLHLSGTKGNRD